MERIIYCPNEEFLEDAQELSRVAQLPIVVGDSENTKLLNFDRSTVCVVKIPRVKEILVWSPRIKQGMHQSVIITDEFCEDIKEYILNVDNSDIAPLYREKNRAKWVFDCTESGNMEINVYVGNNKVDVVEYYVY